MMMMVKTRRIAVALAVAIPGCVTDADVGGKPQDDVGADGTAEDTTDGDTTDGDTTGAESGRCVRLDGAIEGDWALHCASSVDDTIAGAGVDAAGNVYFGMRHRSLEDAPVTIEIGDVSITNTNQQYMVLAKLDPQGEFLWVRAFGGERGGPYLADTKVCGDGVLVTGSGEAGVLDLGGGPLAHHEFLAMFGEDGEHRWSRSFEIQEPDGHVHLNGIACDASGNVFATGEFRDGVDFGDGMITGGVRDVFVAMFDDTGAVQWRRSFGATGSNAAGRSLALTADGIVAVGSFTEQIDPGSGTLGTDNDDDVFIAAYDFAGEPKWSRQLGPDGLQYARSVAVADDGTIAVIGNFLDTIEIGDATYENVFPYDEQEPDIDGTNYDVYIATFDAEGEVGWSARRGTRGDDAVPAMTWAADGTLLMLGPSMPDGIQLDGYDEGAVADLLELTPDASASASDIVEIADGRLLFAMQVFADGAFSFGGMAMTAQGADDLVIAKLSR